MLSACMLLALTLPAASPDRPDDAIVESFVAARAAEGGSRLERHPALDAAARAEAVELAAGRGRPARRPVGAAAARIRREGFRAATFSAGFWRTSAPRIADPSAVLPSWERVSPGFVREVLTGAWTHIGIAVTEGAGGSLVALVVARDRMADLRLVAERYADRDGLRGALHDASNAAREARGLPVLVRDARLDRAAQRHAEAMLEEGYYAHRSPAGTSPADRARGAGFAFRHAVAENIAKGAFSVQEVVDRWLRSSDHRKNLLRRGPWSLGVGIASQIHDDEVEVVWVQLFAR